MNRVIPIVIVVVLVLLGGLYVLLRPGGEEPAPAPTVASREPEARPAPAPAPAPDAPAAPVAPRRPRPTAPAPAPAPEPEPTPAPVEAAPETGTLHIDADVPNAQVFLDRVFVGTAPAVAKDVKPGTHQLNVSAEGYDGIAQTIDVEPGPRDVKIRFKEVRLNAGINVVHKHRMGSCTGRLTATAQGMRYETSDKDDAFTATFADLETFQIDYLEKNLKIRVRKGKQFNFTDPEGNADRLFVFHRDVEKARDRLKKGDQPAGD